MIHPADYAILSGSVDKERMGRSFALHTFSGNLGFSAGPPVAAVLMAAIGWRSTLLLVGLLGVPVVVSILLQSRILIDQARAPQTQGAGSLSGRDLLTSRTMLLFFLFFMLGAMAGGGVQSWLVTVLHTVKGIDLEAAAAALTAYMAGSTCRRAGRRLVRRHVQAPHPAVRDRPDHPVRPADPGGQLAWLASLTIIALTFVSGMALGASRTPRDVMLKDAAPPGQIGKVFGFVSAGLPLGGAVTPVPFGFLIDKAIRNWCWCWWRSSCCSACSAPGRRRPRRSPGGWWRSRRDSRQRSGRCAIVIGPNPARNRNSGGQSAKTG